VAIRLATFAALALVVITGASGATALFSPAIYSIRPDGSNRTLVWRLDPPVYGRARSRDGRMIAFTRSLYPGPYSWYVTDIFGKDPVRIHADGFPVFSPDGTRLAMSSSAGIYVVNTDDTGLHLVAERGGAPSWSPDGRRLAYLVGTRSDGRNWWDSTIHVVNAEGGGDRVIAQGLSPRWAPRGNRIAFLGLRGGYAVPCFINPDGSRRTCYRGFSVNGRFVWSPDGKRIGFKQASRSRITIVTADGRQIRRFPALNRRFEVLAWSPDSRWLVYQKEAGPYSTPPHGLYVRRVDRPGRERLVVEGSLVGEVRWSLGRISYLVSE
jgi:Tol biopolymer transport system component